MIERFEPVDEYDARLVQGLGGLLGTFNQAGVITAADVHVARRTCGVVGESEDQVALAVALTVRAVRLGSVCLDLAHLVADDAALPGLVALPWPDPQQWLAQVAASPVVGAGVVHVDDGLLSLDRYWREERLVRDLLVARAEQSAPIVDEAVLAAGAPRLFPAGYDEQRAAALAAARQWTTVLTGGPGTGKTTAVAGLLALLAADAQAAGRELRVALTAPTGKAAARLQQSVEEAQGASRFTDDDRRLLGDLRAATLHRLLGSRPDSRTRFRHDRTNRLPHDVIVVDETSMVSLTMMARLIEAVRPDARLVLVGDPDQLASVEAGAVLADLVAGLVRRTPTAVVSLRTTHRFGERIGTLATALRDGDADAALDVLRGGDPTLRLLDPDDAATGVHLRELLLGHAVRMRSAAERGDASSALAIADEHRLLCAHREGPWGAGHWNREVERWLSEREGAPIGGFGAHWYAGRPLLVTANDYSQGLYNGDTGVVVTAPSGAPVAAIATAEGHRLIAPSRLAQVDTLHAMTVHKSQGSQAAAVTVLLPPDDSSLLTRELLYTAVTRAQREVTVVASEAALRHAIAHPAVRASALRTRF